MTTKKPQGNTASLNKIQKFWIANNRSKDVKTLASDIGDSVKSVRNYLKALDRQDARKKLAQEKEEANKPPDKGVKAVKGRVDDFMGKNKRAGAVVMTPAASEMGDASRKGNRMSEGLARNVCKVRPE